MRAVTVSEKGGPERLVITELSPPQASSGSLVVEVAAAGVNFIDIYHREGVYPMEYPITLGLEGAGTVTEVGEGVKGFVVGDRVGWANVLGSYAERHLVPAHLAVPVPDGVDLETAAAVLLQGITAHYLATDTYPLTAGSRCLVHAGAGGVGLLLTQIAKMRGAEVITTVGSDEKAELSRRAGSDMVIVYTRDDFLEAVERVHGPHALDVVYDGVGASTFMKGLDLLRPRGLMVTFGNASGVVPEVSPLILSTKGSLYLTRPTMAHYIQTRDELLGRVDDLFTWIAEGRLEVRIGGRYHLADAAEAHRALAGRDTTGKLLVIP
jgi:NADPH:quinone reductase